MRQFWRSWREYFTRRRYERLASRADEAARRIINDLTLANAELREEKRLLEADKRVLGQEIEHLYLRIERFNMEVQADIAAHAKAIVQANPGSAQALVGTK